MGRKKKKQKRKNLPAYNRKTLRNYILDIFRNEPNKLFNYKQIAKRLDIKDNQTRNLINTVLYDLTGEETLPAQLRGVVHWLNTAIRPQPDLAVDELGGETAVLRPLA